MNPWVYLHDPSLIIQEPFAVVCLVLWIWMLIHCARNDPERGMWLWILFIGSAPAALLYFFIRWLPGRRMRGGAGGSFFSRWAKAREIPRLEAAARNIGNAHQFVELGEAYRETGKQDRAAECFSKALEKDGNSLPALWGAAQVDISRKSLASARTHLERILAADGTYKFGDVSLAHCRTLCLLNESGVARERLEEHLKRWTHPEAYVLLASILSDQGDHATARRHLESMLLDLRGGPAFFARQNRTWERKAKRLLARLPTASA